MIPTKLPTSFAGISLPPEPYRTAVKTIAAVAGIFSVVYLSYRIYRRYYPSHPVSRPPVIPPTTSKQQVQQRTFSSSAHTSQYQQPSSIISDNNLSPSSNPSNASTTSTPALPEAEAKKEQKKTILDEDGFGSCDEDSDFDIPLSSNSSTLLGAKIQPSQEDLMASSDDDEFCDFSSDEDSSDTLPPRSSSTSSTPPATVILQPPNLNPLASKTPDPLAQLREALPGMHFTCNEQNEAQIFFADYLLKTILRKDEIQECVFEQNRFKLTYSNSKSVQFKKLPSKAWEAMPLWANGIITPLLRVAPDTHISPILEGEIIRNSKGIKMSFKDNSIYLGKNSLGSAGYLKSIFAFYDPKENKGDYLSIEIEHNVPSIPFVGSVPKSGRIDHQVFADIIHMNFFPDLYT